MLACLQVPAAPSLGLSRNVKHVRCHDVLIHGSFFFFNEETEETIKYFHDTVHEIWVCEYSMFTTIPFDSVEHQPSELGFSRVGHSSGCKCS